jgi:hypothetical protein
LPDEIRLNDEVTTMANMRERELKKLRETTIVLASQIMDGIATGKQYSASYYNGVRSAMRELANGDDADVSLIATYLEETRRALLRNAKYVK